MDLHARMLPLPLTAACWVALAALLVGAAWGARADPALRGHRFPGALVAVLVLWQMRAVTGDGVALHLLGAALLQLLLGWRLALLGLTAVVAGHTANGAGSWAGLAVNALLMGAVPVLVSHAVCRVVDRRAPGNPFAYILGCGFAGGGFSMAATLGVSTTVLLAVADVSTDRVLDEYAVSGLLLVFPEAFVTGTLTAWLAMFYPGAVATWKPPWEDGGRG